MKKKRPTIPVVCTRESFVLPVLSSSREVYIIILMFMNFHVAFKVCLVEVILTQQVILKNCTGNVTGLTFIILRFPVSNTAVTFYMKLLL
jgi:hypothetical protein